MTDGRRLEDLQRVNEALNHVERSLNDLQILVDKSFFINFSSETTSPSTETYTITSETTTFFITIQDTTTEKSLVNSSPAIYQSFASDMMPTSTTTDETATNSRIETSSEIFYHPSTSLINTDESPVSSVGTIPATTFHPVVSPKQTGEASASTTPNTPTSSLPSIHDHTTRATIMPQSPLPPEEITESPVPEMQFTTTYQTSLSPSTNAIFAPVTTTESLATHDSLATLTPYNESSTLHDSLSIATPDTDLPIPTMNSPSTTEYVTSTITESPYRDTPETFTSLVTELPSSDKFAASTQTTSLSEDEYVTQATATEAPFTDSPVTHPMLISETASTDVSVTSVPENELSTSLNSSPNAESAFMNLSDTLSSFDSEFLSTKESTSNVTETSKVDSSLISVETTSSTLLEEHVTSLSVTESLLTATPVASLATTGSLENESYTNGFYQTSESHLKEIFETSEFESTELPFAHDYVTFPLDENETLVSDNFLDPHLPTTELPVMHEAVTLHLPINEPNSTTESLTSTTKYTPVRSPPLTTEYMTYTMLITDATVIDTSMSSFSRGTESPSTDVFETSNFQTTESLNVNTHATFPSQMDKSPLSDAHVSSNIPVTEMLVTHESLVSYMHTTASPLQISNSTSTDDSVVSSQSNESHPEAETTTLPLPTTASSKNVHTSLITTESSATDTITASFQTSHLPLTKASVVELETTYVPETSPLSSTESILRDMPSFMETVKSPLVNVNMTELPFTLIQNESSRNETPFISLSTTESILAIPDVNLTESVYVTTSVASLVIPESQVLEISSFSHLPATSLSSTHTPTTPLPTTEQSLTDELVTSLHTHESATTHVPETSVSVAESSSTLLTESQITNNLGTSYLIPSQFNSTSTPVNAQLPMTEIYSATSNSSSFSALHESIPTDVSVNVSTQTFISTPLPSNETSTADESVMSLPTTGTTLANKTDEAGIFLPARELSPENTDIISTLPTTSPSVRGAYVTSPLPITDVFSLETSMSQFSPASEQELINEPVTSLTADDMPSKDSPGISLVTQSLSSEAPENFTALKSDLFTANATTVSLLTSELSSTDAFENHHLLIESSTTIKDDTHSTVTAEFSADTTITALNSESVTTNPTADLIFPTTEMPVTNFTVSISSTTEVPSKFSAISLSPTDSPITLGPINTSLPINDLYTTDMHSSTPRTSGAFIPEPTNTPYPPSTSFSPKTISTSSQRPSGNSRKVTGSRKTNGNGRFRRSVPSLSGRNEEHLKEAFINETKQKLVHNENDKKRMYGTKIHSRQSTGETRLKIKRDVSYKANTSVSSTYEELGNLNVTLTANETTIYDWWDQVNVTVKSIDELIAKIANGSQHLSLANRLESEASTLDNLVVKGYDEPQLISDSLPEELEEFMNLISDVRETVNTTRDNVRKDIKAIQVSQFRIHILVSYLP